MVGGRLELAGARRVEGEVGEVFLLPERDKIFGACDLVLRSVSRSE